ncbi:MAG: TIGR00341 family protein [Gammaproteobacteria bacterium]|nr:TIGR00341 family protein [Gammaproteobacteria bacterium]
MKLIEVIADDNITETVSDIARRNNALDFRLAQKGEEGRQAIRILLLDEMVQTTLDALQTVVSSHPTARIIVIPVDATLPLPKQSQQTKKSTTTSREALYDSVSKNAVLDSNFIVLVILSTLVAAIGLIKNNVAVVIGAMVIAPLLGPNLALGLGTALGDMDLMRKALKTNLAGVSLAIGISIFLGLTWPFDINSPELLARTDVGMDSLALALASGAAAALSLTTGLSSVLVGVMVAVALLPPAATFGLMLGHGQYQMAVGAALLLIANVVCVNLATKVVFMVKGISPRTWWQKEKAKKAMTIYILVWLTGLIILAIAIYLRGNIQF